MEVTLGLWARPAPLLMWEVPPITLRVTKEINQAKDTYLIGPLRKEFNMFLELVAFVPSICFDKLIEEFKPPAVKCVLAWLRKTRL